MRIGIMAYEVSADRLGEGLLRQLQERLGEVAIEGVVGERLQAAGCRSLMPADDLAVMGLFEVLRHLLSLLRARSRLRRHFSDSRPDLFIGIDAPDFNLPLERALRRQGLLIVHYVSPSFWAWRQGRVKGLAEAADLVLSIFPFELAFLQRHGVNARYVGHPLAQQIPLQVDQLQARAQLGLPAQGEVVALLPGSRSSEIGRLTEPFVRAARLLQQRRPGVRFILPLAKPAHRQRLQQELLRLGQGLDVTLCEDSHPAMAAADVLLTASGTATIEGLMHKRPMVVGYRVNGLTYQILRRLIRVPWVAMANLLAEDELAPEFLQERCQPELLANALHDLLEDHPRRQRIAHRYAEIHEQLRLDSARLAADAVIELLEGRGCHVS